MNQPTEVIDRARKIITSTTQILQHQAEIANLKGENFNIFSILKMENRENDTHSAFLGELLNPNGSHNFGNIFLHHFLKTIGQEDHIDINNAKVYLEYYVGPRDDSAKIGGFVDIFIRDDYGNTLCLENKIGAIDQKTQIARYCNYNQSRNKVYYLTLKDIGPEPYSFCDKKLDEDFYIIKYKNEIIDWLEACSKEATDQPIIRESIKQYIILLKKLTNQLSDTKMVKEIKELIIANYSAARTISSNIEIVELECTLIFLNDIKKQLDIALNEGGQAWKIEVSEDLNQAWSGLYISHKSWPENTYIQLQGNSKIPWSHTGYGIVAHDNIVCNAIKDSDLKNTTLLATGFRSHTKWPFYKLILPFDNTDERAKLMDKNERNNLVSSTVEKLIEICKICKLPVSEIKK
ncbi:PDDEXK-like family protein [Cellulophaga baltica]|uniref:PDDEXK-like family protein n=1 Tax=Cellulophaga baltica TaxID=76594 RepID=UPI0003FAB641|nr:PD-(D/E)XK nuclease family protein [Cellulophaga baltica]